MTRLVCSLSLLLALLANPNFAHADAAADLAAGQAALQELSLEKALPLLKSAAEALPNSVEAQLTLAECHLRLGSLDDALASYKAVVKLSADHKLATRMVAALTGRDTSFDKQLAMTRAFMAVEDFAAAARTAAIAATLPADEKQRLTVQLLQAECTLWSGKPADAFSQALAIVQQGDAESVAVARIIAALSLVENPKNNRDVEALLKQAGNVAEPWKARAEFAAALLLVHDLSQAQAASESIGKTHGSIPASSFRTANVQRSFERLVLQIRDLRQRGEFAAAWSVLRPMAISQAAQLAAEKAEAGATTLADANTGWIVNPTATVNDRLVVASEFAQSAQSELLPRGVKNGLMGYRIAAAICDGNVERDAKLTESLVRFATQLGTFSRVDSSRKPGDALSTADAVQAELLTRLAKSAVTQQDRDAIVALIIGQLQRYSEADDLETGLKQFVAGKPDMIVSMTSPFAMFPLDDARRNLLNFLATSYASLGEKSAAAAERAIVKAGLTLSDHDAIALQLCGQSQLQFPDHPDAHNTAINIVNRYSAKANWAEAGAALAIFYAGRDGSGGQWANVNLVLQQGRFLENQLVAARRSIGAELSAQAKAALVKAVAVVNASVDTPTQKSDRLAAVQVAGELINRYASLGRLDLSEAVIASLADGEGGAKSLGDWALWSRINLLHVQASESLARTATSTLDRAKLVIDAKHTAELALLTQLITGHATSDYALAAVERVAELSTGYQAYRAFPAATSILADFLKAHPTLAAVQRFEYLLVDLKLSDANNELNETVAKNPKVEKMSAKHLAAINAIAEFLKKYPVGDYSRAAEDQLFGVLQRYGEVGAWNVSREVLAEFTKALPDYRSPAHLKLLEAATFLGELDTKHGHLLLNPNPSLPATTLISKQTEIAELDIGQLPADGKFKFSDFSGDVSKSVATKEAPGGKPVSEPSGEGPSEGSDPAVERGLASSLPGVPIGGGFGGGGGPFGNTATPTTPSASSLAMIRQSQSQQFQQLAMLEGKLDGDAAADKLERGQMSVTLPSGTILSLAEMTRQDTASNNAYKILIELAKSSDLSDRLIAEQARGELMWMFGYFEGSLRYDRAIALLKKYLVDNKNDPDHVALAYRVLEDRLAQVSQPPANGQMDQPWVEARHTQFENARVEIADFVATYNQQEAWANSARLLRVTSYQTEANLVAAFSGERASGLLVQSANALLELQKAAPNHPDAAGFPTQLWNIAEQLASRNHSESAISVLRQLAVKYPTEQLGTQSIIRIAQLYGSNLSNPILAVKTYQEYLNKTAGDAAVPTEIYNIANQLAQQQRFLEALHVYGVFVDSFPTDGRASEALHAIGKTHQANAAWQEAIDSYDRVFEDYPESPVIPLARLDVAECYINLGEWSEARGLYEEYLEKYPQHPQVAMATARLDVLKKLDRFQDLLADDAVDRNKDDAQFQIGKTVLAELSNPIKAVAEFRKVVKDYPNSDVADDAQLEIGRTLLSLNQLEDGRAELLKLPKNYPGSPLADDALFSVAQSYEQFAVRIAAVTIESAREESHRMEQNQAYVRFNKQIEVDTERDSQRRGELKKSGKSQELALNDAAFAWQQGSSQVSNLFCHVTQAELLTETETALQVANRRDRINDAFREAVVMYAKAAMDYPLGDMTDQSLLRVADILETKLKDRTAAMQTYQRIVKLFPGTPVAEDAAWKVATFHVQEGKYAAAADAFQNFIRNYPGSSRVAEAQFGMAEVYEQLGRWNEAMDAYEVFRQKFNTHPKVTLAAQQITWIKTYRK